MAISASGEGVSAPVPFSYAQAAKGRAAPSAVPATTPATSVKESNAWTDDSSDTQTATEDQQSNGTANGNGALVKPRATEKPSLNGQQAETAQAVSHPSSPLYDSSATTAKEDEVNSPVKPSLDPVWDQKSSSSRPGESLQDSGKDGDVSQDSKKEADAEQTWSKPMKEAPVPIVNFWQKRAEELKAKQTTATGPGNGDTSARQPSQTVKASPDSSTATTNANQTNANGATPAPQDAATAGNKARGPKSHRAQKSESSSPKSAPLPPTRDESAWPTPLTAQDEERRKAQDKPEKPEKEKAQPTTAKPHGKNEWVPVPYTPTVKFNTPLPQTRGRGGRVGGRGGRGGSLGERGSAVPGAAPPREESTTSETRGRAENEGRRASVQATTASRTSSANEAASSDKRLATGTTNKRQSLQDDTVLASQSRSNQSGQRSARPAADKAGVAPEFGTTQPVSVEETMTPKPKSGAQDLQLADRRLSLPVPPENGQEANQQIRSKRPSPQRNEPQDTTEEKSIQPRAASEQSNTANKPQRAESRSSGPQRPFDGHRESWGQLPLRDGRSERGRARGGRGNHFTMSHHGAGQLQNSANLPPIQTNGPYSSKSSSTFQSQYFSQGNQPMSDRRSFPQGPRSASIPSDVSFGRYGQGYIGTQQVPLYSPYLTAPYEYGAVPMSAIPYTPSMDQSMVINGVAFQINYYFSLENLLKDVFLRKHMDSQGFVSLNFIANFQRMKDLTTDFELIKFACSHSPDFELRQGTDGQVRIRIKEGWDKWILNMEDRDVSAQNDGPPPPPQQANTHTPQDFDLHALARSPFADAMSPSGDGGITPYGLTPSFQPVAVTSPIDGARSPRETSDVQSPPMQGNNGLAAQYTSADAVHNGVGDYGHEDADSFPNSQVPYLTVAVRPFGSSGARRISRSEASRTFSNGSISMEELNLSDDAQSQSKEEPAERDNLQKMLQARKQHSSPSPNSNTPNEPSADSVELFWFKGQESRQPLPSNGNTEPYVQLHVKALEERQHAESGTCPHDLDILYQFWSHFLIRNFNTAMYNEFRQLAHDDAAQGLSNVGMQSLITFYSEALSSQQPIRDRVARHYVSLVKNEDLSKSRPAFEQLRSAWRNGALNMKNRKRISAYVDQELRDELDKVER